jgi:hypothetical protein
MLARWHYRAEPNCLTPYFPNQHLPGKSYPMIAIARHEAESTSQLSHHAAKRMQMRNISAEDIECALDYGRTFHSRGAVFKVIGRKEIDRYTAEVDLHHLDGLHVLCSRDGRVITVYRNPGFRAKNYPNQPRGSRRSPRRLRR